MLIAQARQSMCGHGLSLYALNLIAGLAGQAQLITIYMAWTTSGSDARAHGVRRAAMQLARV